MNIKTRVDASDKWIDVKVKIGETSVDLGFHDAKQALDLADDLLAAAQELVQFARDVRVPLHL